MAVIEHLGLAVSIEINGVATPEYDDPEPCDNIGDPAYTAVCHKYIESRDDAEYVIRCRVTDKQKWLRESKDRCLHFWALIDGKFARGAGMRNGHDYEVVIKGIESSATTLHGFRFTAVNTGEGVCFLLSDQVIDFLG
jgi:hypothetical protein